MTFCLGLLKIFSEVYSGIHWVVGPNFQHGFSAVAVRTWNGDFYTPHLCVRIVFPEVC